MRRFVLIFKNDIKLFSKQVLPILSLILAILFIFIARNYSFERGKSTIYVNVKGNNATAEFLKLQAQKDNSTVVLDSKDKVKKNMSINPFSYGLNIDTDKNRVDIIIKGYESEKVVNNIKMMSTFLLNNSQDFSDIDVEYVHSKVNVKVQKEKQIVPIFAYLEVSVMPLLLTFILMLDQRTIMGKTAELMSDYKICLTSKMIISIVFHMCLSIMIAYFSCNNGFDILAFMYFAFLSCAISSSIGLALSAIYNSVYNSLKAILAISIFIVLPIWNLSFGSKRYLLYVDFFMIPYKAIRDIILYKEIDKIDYSLALYPVFIITAIFVFVLMFYKKINRLQNIKL